ncbi:unknown protein [Seminavis robusta]|uniref:Tc1-like transposase DDE domain-containing protein n=1 Tax=Seminavis robusta TaxID=568900 RepID=A0A9N8DHK0_9STRA|nr:unknown protein [Seminavis robusta]|eukprot:Sro69_g038642.1  (430) ;mRNA; f:96858-98147
MARATIKDSKTNRPVGMNINDVNIQEAAINRACEFMGSDLYAYGIGSKRKYKHANTLLREVRKTCGFQVSYRQLQRWISYYKKFGEAPVRARREHRTTIKGLRTLNPKDFTTTDQDILKDIVDQEPQLYLDEIQERLAARTGKAWTTSTIWRHLHSKRIGYSLKTAVHKARQQSLTEVARFHVRMNDYVQHPSQLIYVDETARSTKASRRRRGWSPRGVTPVITSRMEREFDRKYTLIAACNWNGFEISACHIVERETSNRDNNPDRGTVDTERFEHWVEHFLVPALGSFVDGEPNSIVVMDNASIHLSDRITELIANTGAIMVLTAPYSPEFNPIENMFKIYKDSLKRLSYDSSNHWTANHYWSLNAVTPDMAKTFFRKCEVPGMADWYREQQLEKEENELLFLAVLPPRLILCHELLFGSDSEDGLL